MGLSGRRFERCVHHLVLEAFVGPRPAGMQGCHRDDDPRNNALDNLRWDTPAGNKSDAVRRGTAAGAENFRGATGAQTSDGQESEAMRRYQAGRQKRTPRQIRAAATERQRKYRDKKSKETA